MTSMLEQNISPARPEESVKAAPGLTYEFSPRVVVLAGPPACGKSYAAKQLRHDFGYKVISLDGINIEIKKKYGNDIEAVRNPETYNDYKLAFGKILRGLRYRDLVLEGCRVSHPHIFEAFRNTLYDLYSPYTFFQPFYLNPPEEVRKERYLLRKISLIKKGVKDGDPGVSEAAMKQPFCEMLEPVLPGFAEVEDAAAVMQWAAHFQGQAHPGVPEEDRAAFKAVAESESFNPFYQTIEYRGRTLVPGFTASGLAWDNILKLGVDFRGKSLCDYGCMHGYYSFKAEEAGAACVGLDVDQGAVDLSNHLARLKGSNSHFMVYDINTPLGRQFDVIMALNVLHRTGKFELTVENMFRHCRECILEVGQSQLPVIIGEGVRQGFKLLKNIPSHRTQSCIGPRRLLHMAKA